MCKHLILLTAMLPLLSACAEGSSAPPTPSLIVGFGDDSTAARMGSPVIEVKAANPQPLVSAELVGAGGTVIAAAPGQLEPQIPAGGYPFGPSFSIFGGSWSGGGWGGGSGSGGGVGVSMPIGGYGSTTVPPGDLVRSRALILVPDMESYRRNWENSKVRVKFGNTAGDANVAEIPAPAPGGR